MLLVGPCLQPRHSCAPPALTPCPPAPVTIEKITGATRSRRAQKHPQTRQNTKSRPRHRTPRPLLPTPSTTGQVFPDQLTNRRLRRAGQDGDAHRDRLREHLIQDAPTGMVAITAGGAAFPIASYQTLGERCAAGVRFRAPGSRRNDCPFRRTAGWRRLALSFGGRALYHVLHTGSQYDPPAGHATAVRQLKNRLSPPTRQHRPTGALTARALAHTAHVRRVVRGIRLVRVRRPVLDTSGTQHT